jgi:hypothetical protein
MGNRDPASEAEAAATARQAIARRPKGLKEAILELGAERVISARKPEFCQEVTSYGSRKQPGEEMRAEHQGRSTDPGGPFLQSLDQNVDLLLFRHRRNLSGTWIVQLETTVGQEGISDPLDHQNTLSQIRGTDG